MSSAHAAADLAPIRQPAPARSTLLLEWTPARTVIALIVVTACIRLVAAAVLGLGVDESYTVGNARTLAWSYVDYPPLHVWLVGVWSWFWGSESAIVVRLPFILLFAGSTWLMFRMTARLFDETAGLWAAVLLNVMPVFTLPHASWVLPDGPLAFFSLGAAYVTASLLFDGTERKASVARWLLAGFLTGLALLCKYHAAFLVLGIFVFLLTTPDKRRLLATKGPWLAAAAVLVMSPPVLIWNAQHGWIGVSFQAKRVHSFMHPDVLRMLSYAGEQALYLAPWLFLPLAFVLGRALWRGPSAQRSWFLALIAVGPIVFFTAASLFARGLPHWPMPGWLFAIPLLGAETALLAQRHGRLVRYGVAATGALIFVALVLVASEGATGWLVSSPTAEAAQSDPTLEMLNWTEVKQVLAQRELLNGGTAAIAGTNWIEAGKLNYAVGSDIPVLCLCADPQQFRYSRNVSDFAGQTVMVIQSRDRLSKSRALLAKQFRQLQPLAGITLHRANRPAIDLVVLRGIGFAPETKS